MEGRRTRTTLRRSAALVNYTALDKIVMSCISNVLHRNVMPKSNFTLSYCDSSSILKIWSTSANPLSLETPLWAFFLDWFFSQSYDVANIGNRLQVELATCSECALPNLYHQIWVHEWEESRFFKESCYIWVTCWNMLFEDDNFS